ARPASAALAPVVPAFVEPLFAELLVVAAHKIASVQLGALCTQSASVCASSAFTCTLIRQDSRHASSQTSLMLVLSAQVCRIEAHPAPQSTVPASPCPPFPPPVPVPFALPVPFVFPVAPVLPPNPPPATPPPVDEPVVPPVALSPELPQARRVGKSK